MEDIRQGFKHLVGVPHKEPLMETQMSKYVKCLVLILQALPMAVNKGETHPIASIGILDQRAWAGRASFKRGTAASRMSLHQF